MNTIKLLVERWWYQLLFFAWFLALTGLLANQQYTAFLRPEFGYVLVLGTLTLLGFLIIGLGEARQRKFGLSQALHALILILPLAYLINAQDTTLDIYAFKNRSLGLPTVNPAAKQAKSVEDTSRNDSLPTLGSIPVTLVNLFYTPNTYEGKRVQLIGMLRKDDPQVKENFGKDCFIVFRFVITCCAADASPVAVLVKGDNLPDIDENTWVEVEGTFKMQEKMGNYVPILEKSTLRNIKAPQQPYLF